MRLFAALAVMTMLVNPVVAEVQPLSDLKKGDTIDGFRTEAIYLNAAGASIGARFIHERSGFTLDYLQIESVPQGYTWVTSLPVSDQGEPHTQEHLLLGKGTTGRAFAGLDTMWLSGSTAFTQQRHTSYHFNTSAGKDVFFDLFAAELNALLHPNYSDEEIRREVRSFGVTTNPDGTLRLEEKGSVYNEMTSSSANRYRVLYRTFGQQVYGAAHPLSYNSGGEPSGIRTMQPEDIRAFHAANYYLANMGTIVAFSKDVSLAEVLRRTRSILERVEKEPKTRAATSERPLPPPAPAKPGAISVAEYPHRNDAQPSPLAFTFPATRIDLPLDDVLLLELFVDTFAGDATTNLYKLFVDSNTRVMDTGATSVFGSVDRDYGHPLTFALDNVAVANFNDETIGKIRAVLMNELARIAAFPDGSPELADFNARVSSRVMELERELANFVNSPPSWGARSTFSGWLDQLLLLERSDDFRKSLTLTPQIASVRKQLSTRENVWRKALPKWQLIDVMPYAAAAKPSPALLAREESERAARAAAETARLEALYELDDAQAALRRYQAEQDAAGAEIEEEARKVTPPEFVKNPPMTLDDTLRFAQSRVAGVPLVASTFDNMTSATLGLALDVRKTPREHLRHLSLLPVLLTRTGVIENGKPVSWDEMSERLRKEVLRLDASFSTNARTGRVELTLRGAGLGDAEAKRAVEWLGLVLHHPDWRIENLPRIRDVVDQQLSGLRNAMQGSEESWVNNPANAWRMQTSRAWLAADSMLTRSHNALRLRWLLQEPPDAERAALEAWFTALATRRGSRDELKAVLANADTVAGLTEPAAALAREALRDLDLALIEIPDATLTADWTYLVTALRDDLLTPPSTTLEAMHALRLGLLRRDDARMWLVGSTAMQKTLAPSIASLASSLADQPSATAAAVGGQHIASRLLERHEKGQRPVYLGLLAPNMSNGVIITSVPSAHFSDAEDKEKQLDYLAGRLHAGYGAHGVFLKTLAAGLAYSNGLRGSVQSGRGGYYAERTPEIPQTVKFVVDLLENAERDPKLADYAVAQVFGESRAAANYEARAEGIAADLADDQPPSQVQRFRESILALRTDPKLGDKLFDRKDRVYARALPGYGIKGADVKDAMYFAIGPEKQLSAWEAYLKNADGAETTLFRLYPRDYWMP